MHYGRLLIQREVQELWRRPAYWITTGLMVTLVVATLLLIPWLQQYQTTWSWSLRAPTLTQTTALQHSVSQNLARDHVRIHWTTPAHARLVIQVRPSSLFGQRVHVDIRRNPSPTRQAVVTWLMPGIMAERLAQMPHPAVWQQLSQPPHLLWHQNPRVRAAPSVGRTSITTVLSLVVFIILSVYGQVVMYSVSAEKASRLSELLSVHISSTILLLSKWAGVGIAAVTQMLMVLVAGLTVITIDPAVQHLVNQWHLSAGSWGLWVTTLVALISGYGFYGTLFLAMGSSLNRPEESRSAVGLPTVGMFAAYGSLFYGLTHPATAITAGLTLVPPFFPFLILLDQGFGLATWWQWLIGGIATLLSIMGLLVWATHQYRRTLYHHTLTRYRRWARWLQFRQ